jgi:hypothetical protein
MQVSLDGGWGKGKGRRKGWMGALEWLDDRWRLERMKLSLYENACVCRD